MSKWLNVTYCKVLWVTSNTRKSLEVHLSFQVRQTEQKQKKNQNKTMKNSIFMLKKTQGDKTIFFHQSYGHDNCWGISALNSVTKVIMCFPLFHSILCWSFSHIFTMSLKFIVVFVEADRRRCERNEDNSSSSMSLERYHDCNFRDEYCCMYQLMI